METIVSQQEYYCVADIRVRVLPGVVGCEKGQTGSNLKCLLQSCYNILHFHRYQFLLPLCTVLFGRALSLSLFLDT